MVTWADAVSCLCHVYSVIRAPNESQGTINIQSIFTQRMCSGKMRAHLRCWLGPWHTGTSYQVSSHSWDLSLPHTGIPGQEDYENAPADLFSFYPVDDGVQHGKDHQMDIGHEDMNGRQAWMLAILVNHGQASHGEVQDQDCKDTGQAVFQSLRCSLWDVMLRMALAISTYDTKMRIRTNVRKRLAKAKPHLLLNMSAHTSLIRSCPDAVSVGRYMALAEGQSFQYHKWADSW